MVNKKILIFASVFFLIFLLGNISGFVGGDGTAQNPYQISTCSWLQDINDNSSTLGANYKLINNIDCDVAPFNTGSGFSPIGFPASFTGTLDGNNHTINKLYSNHPGFLNSGLFAFTSSTVIIKNVGLIDVNIVGAAQNVGSLTLQNGGLISNSYVSGGVIEGTSRVGGLAYENSGTISNSYSNVSIVGSAKYAGGLVATNSGTISNSYALGNVSTNDPGYGYSSRIGGLVGANSGAIYSSYSAGKISVPSWQGTVGGLVSYSSGTCTSSFWDKDTSGKTTSACGIGKTTIEMKTPLTFQTPPSNWNFNNVWNISKSNGYPCLRWDHDCIPVPKSYWTYDSLGTQEITSPIEAPAQYSEIYLVLENPYGTSADWKFNLYEDDSAEDGNDDSILTGASALINPSISGNKIIVKWEITQPDISKANDNGESFPYKFYFITTADSYNYLQSSILNLEWQTGNQPNCIDGIENQDETGIDCGGTSCPACITTPPPVDCSQYNLCSNLPETLCGTSCNFNPQNIDCNDPDINCGCSWSSATNSCSSYFTDTNPTTGGTCAFQEDSSVDPQGCADDGLLEYAVTATWSGAGAKPASCNSDSQSIFCSAQTSLPLENKFGILLTIISIIGIYFVFFRKKNE